MYAQVLDADGFEYNETGDGIGDKSTTEDAFIGRSMIFPDAAIKPDEWKAETERVTSKLLSRKAATGSGGWAENITQLMKHAKLLGGADGGNDILESIRILSVQINDSIAALSRVEKLLNSRPSNESIRRDFKNFQQVL